MRRAESGENAITGAAGWAPGTGAPQAPQKAKPGGIMALQFVHWTPTAPGGGAGTDVAEGADRSGSACLGVAAGAGLLARGCETACGALVVAGALAEIGDAMGSGPDGAAAGTGSGDTAGIPAGGVGLE
ncbi:MAG: hypothetical protein PHU25_10135 [Deltaproteobacteria bacterium]|nr:hypothetical protein [Deltaproteobacteria bacterium]